MKFQVQEMTQIWDGNTILLELEEKKYMFIGNSQEYLLLKQKIKL